MRADYPNVELLVYRAEQIFNDEAGKYLQQETEIFSHYIDTQVYVFRQTWANTATGMFMCSDRLGQIPQLVLTYTAVCLVRRSQMRIQLLCRLILVQRIVIQKLAWKEIVSLLYSLVMHLRIADLILIAHSILMWQTLT